MDAAWARLAVVAALILVNAGFSGSEIALLSLNEGQLRRLAARGGRGRMVARLAANPNEYLATVQIGITLTGFLASATTALTLADTLEPALRPLLGGAAQPVAVVAVTLVLTLVTLVVGELAPKRLAMQWAEPWALLAAPLLAAIARAARPVVWALGVTTNAVVRVVGGSAEARRAPMTPEEFRHFVAGQPAITAMQKQIIAGAVEAGERAVRDVLVPRNAVFSLEHHVTVGEAREQLAAAAHHRAPVVDGGLDRPVGVAVVIDLITAPAEAALADHVRPALVLPETVPVLEALRRMQRERQQMLLVADEFGGIEGIVTVEDLVEELVGEIFDEYDRDLLGVRRQPDGSVEVVGRYPVHDLPQLGVELPAGRGQYSTVAGLVMSELGRLARAGDELEVEGWRLTVLDARGATVRRVRLERSPRAGEAAEGAEA
ncbi:MAG: HlyC/CorC family transporter [Chloroflexi bacterium]|nr:HlyC/CorC family transporter [Chloroflexota bacterium]